MEIELCCASLEAISFAVDHRFSRIELCAALEYGGLTPSIGMIKHAVKQIETHVLIRPRAGDFCYSEHEKAICICDIEQAIHVGATGIVIGSLTPEKEIDIAWIETLIERYPATTWTFHRAFDETSNCEKALESLIHAGFHRVLTSGQTLTVELGKNQIKKLVDQAENRIEIMIGGGVKKNTIASICSETKPHAVHFSGTRREIVATGTLYQYEGLVFDLEAAIGIFEELQK
jgi:copper homeostasis protein